MIRYACRSDADRLTEIAFSAKRHWQYPEEYYQQWTRELTITDQYITQNIVKCLLSNSAIIGFYSLCFVDKDQLFADIRVECGYWLDHMFLEEKSIGKGFGTEMFIDLHKEIRKRNISQFKVFVDPNATGFYEKMGCKFLRNSSSSIKDRIIPVYEFFS